MRIINLKYFLSLIILLLLVNHIQAQDEEDKNAQIFCLSRAYQDSIKIRWAPDKATAWYYLNKHGYLIERTTLVVDGQLLKDPIVITLTQEPLKPKPLDVWEPYSEIDDYIGVAAQAIFGETFEVSSSLQQGDFASVVNRAREFESRYSFAIFSADMSPRVAEFSGLAYTDKNVKPGEQYLYKIIPLVPQEFEVIDTGYVYTSVDDYFELPPLKNLMGEFRDGMAMITWEYRYFETIYSSFIVERSDDDGNSFKRITDLPLVNTYRDENDVPERFFYIDSLPQNDKLFMYRVRGINPFGEIGPPSDTISGSGARIIPLNPAIINHEVFAGQALKFEWHLADSLNIYIKGFKIKRSMDDKGPFETLNDTLLPASNRDFVDIQPMGTNFYKVFTIDKHDKEHSSFPYMVKLIDSIPPEPPLGLEGEIDTNGIVTLSWHANSEQDLLGYRVYRANHKRDEYYQKTVEPCNDTVFIDTVNVKTLTKKIYYKILAVDQHFNPSEFSDTLALVRPDKIPPVQAVFSAVETDENGILLTWIPSSSDDVIQHILYRKALKETKWSVIKVFDMLDTATTYQDTSVMAGKLYQYTLLAVDDNGLESGPSKPVTMKAYVNKIRPSIEDIKYRADRDNKQIYITWKYPYNGVERYVFYRAENEEPINMYKSVGGENEEFIDERLKPNNIYTYRMKVIFEDGTQSGFSEKFTVQF